MVKQYIDMKAEDLSQIWSSFHDEIKSYHAKYTVLFNSTLDLIVAAKQSINLNQILESNTRDIADDPCFPALNHIVSVLDSFKTGFALILRRLENIKIKESLFPKFPVVHNMLVKDQLAQIAELCTILTTCMDIANFLLKS